VLVRGRTILSYATSARTDSLTLSIRKLLGQFDLRGVRRPTVIAGIGPFACHLKPLSGLPESAKATLLSEAVRENVDRYFLRSTHGWYVSELHRSGGAWRAAVVDRAVVDELRAACTELRLSLLGSVPTVGTLGKAFHDGVLSWQDGDIQLLLTLKDGECMSATHRPVGAATAATAAPRVALRSEDPDFVAIADAYAVSQCKGQAPFLVRGTAPVRPSPVRRAVLAGLTLAIGAAALVAPTVSLLRDGAVAEHRVSAKADSVARLQAVEVQLREISAELSEIARFAASRRSTVALLGAISQALPESTAIVSLHTDTTGGTIVFVSRNAADVLPALTSVQGLAAPEFVGALTGEVIEGVDVQRGGVRFSFARDPSRPAHAADARAGVAR
jgi:hypothetical protein